MSSEVLCSAYVDSTPIAIKLNFKTNNYKIRVGDEIGVNTQIRKIEDNNPSASGFDYATYMRRQGILYTCAVDTSEYRILGHHNTLQYWADYAKCRLIHLIRLTGVENQTAHLAIVFCTGDRRYMPDSDKLAFSQAGVAHILAVSGLHIGIVICLLSILLYPLRRPRYKILNSVILLTGIWAYVFFTGMPLSAIRAAIMASFIIASSMFLKKHSSVNALAASALFILIFSPYAIFDAGFQLSYLSVIGILLWSDIITDKLKSSNKIIKYIVSSIAVTIAAQLTTAPAIIYYFQSFPTGFFLANLLILPILPVFFFATILGIIFATMGLKIGIITMALDMLYKLLKDIADISSQFLNVIDSIWIDSTSAIIATCLVFSVGIVLRFHTQRQVKYIPFILSICLIFCLTIKHNLVKRNGEFLEEQYDSTNLVVYRGNRLYLFNSLNDTTLLSEFSARNERFISEHDIKSIVYNCNKSTDNIYFSYPFAFVGGKSYVFLTGNYRRKHKTGNPIKVDYAILTKRFYNQLPDIPKYIIADTIILPREIYESRRDTLISYAIRHKIPVKY